MPPLSCVCPHCDITLRVKDRTYLNRPIPCPACRVLLVLAVTESEQLTATLDESAESDSAISASTVSKSGNTTLSRQLREWAANVTVVSWAATLLVAGMIGILIWRSDRPRSRPPLEQTAETESVTLGEVPSAAAVEPERTPEIRLDVPAQLANPVATTKSKPATADVKPVDVPPVDALTVVKPSPPKLQPDPVAENPPKVDFERALSQPLSAFRQSRAIARLELLQLLEELLGAPIRYDVDDLGNTATQLEETMTVDLHDITVRDVLGKVLHDTGIVYEEERDGLRLRKESIEAGDGPVR